MDRTIARVLIACLVVFTGLTGSATAAPPALDGLAFVYANVDDGNLYTVEPETGELTQLTTSGGTDNPAFSPDGRTIAFDRSGDVWLRKPGGAVKRLTFNGQSSYPTWSPDGKRIAYSRVVRGDLTDIYVVPASGGPSTRVSFAAKLGCAAAQPNWAPKGSLLTYRRTSTGGRCRPGIVTQTIGQTARVIVPAAAPADFIDQPRFTDDGRHVLYISSCDPEVCGNRAVWQVPVSGGEAQEVVTHLDCIEGNLCLKGVVASPTGGDWLVQASLVNLDTEAITTCFEPPGTDAFVPDFCVRDVLAGNNFDVRLT